MAPLRPGSPGRRPSGSRPESAGRTAARAAARRTAARTPVAPVASRSGITTRAAVLGLVVCALVLSAAVPLREYVSQRGEISRALAQQAEQRQRVAALEARKKQLEDPAYVKQVARERLHYVMPGETAYLVLQPDAPAAEPDAPAVKPSGSSAPWYSQLWGSVQAADAGR